MTAHSNALLCLCLIAGCTTATKEENTAGPKPDAEEPASEPSQMRTFRHGKTCGTEMTALKHSIYELEGGDGIVSTQSKDLLAQASEGLHTKKAAVRVKLLAVPLENLAYSCRQTFLSLEVRFRNIRIRVESTRYHAAMASGHFPANADGEQSNARGDRWTRRQVETPRAGTGWHFGVADCRPRHIK